MSNKPELTPQHSEWWIILFIVFCLCMAVMAFFNYDDEGESGNKKMEYINCLADGNSFYECNQ